MSKTWIWKGIIIIIIIIIMEQELIIITALHTKILKVEYFYFFSTRWGGTWLWKVWNMYSQLALLYEKSR